MILGHLIAQTCVRGASSWVVTAGEIGRMQEQLN